MATKQEYTIGTNAAMPVALKEANDTIAQRVPSIFRINITFEELAPMVADIVVAALDAVDDFRAAQRAQKRKK